MKELLIKIKSAILDVPIEVVSLFLHVALNTSSSFESPRDTADFGNKFVFYF